MARDPSPVSQPLDERIKVQFTADHRALLEQRCDAVGLSVAAYIRALVLKDLDVKDPTHAPSHRTPSKHASMLQVAELHALAMQVKRLGTNVNQMAKQANSGMVPISRAEVIYMLNQHQLLMSKAIAAVEGMLE